MTRRQTLTLALFVFLGVGVLHYGLEPIAKAYQNPAAAHRALFYVGQGMKGVALLSVLAWLAPRRIYAVPLIAACAWGVFEDALVAGCRLARGIESIPSVPLWAGVCQSVTEWPTYVVGAVLGGMAAASLLYELQQPRHGNDNQCPRR